MGMFPKWELDTREVQGFLRECPKGLGESCNTQMEDRTSQAKVFKKHNIQVEA
jgi:hypothetical protein